MKQEEGFVGRFMLLCSSNLLLQGLGFLYRILLSRYAGTEGLGVYRLASSIYTILHATCLAGITMTCTRFAAAWKAEGKSGAISSLVRFAFTLFTSIFSVLACCAWFGREYIGSVLIGDRRVIDAIPIMLVCLFLTGIENVFKSTMIGLNRIQNAVVSELTEQIVRMFVVVVLLIEFSNEDLGRTAVLIFCASVISEIISASIMTGMYLSMLKPKRVSPPDGYRIQILSTVFPVSIASLCSNFISSAGAVVLPKRLVDSGLSFQDAVSMLGAVSGVAAPIITLPMALIASLCTVTMPEISARYSRKGSNEVIGFSEKVLRSVGLIGIPFTALLIPLAPIISRLFFYHAVDQQLFLCMGISCIFCYYQMVTGCLLNGSGHQSWNAATSTAGEIIQLILVWWLSAASELRVYGYIFAQCFAPLFVVICNVALLQRYRIIRFKSMQHVGESVVCGALLYLWTRIFFMIYSGMLNQWAAMILTLLTSFSLYLILLRLLEIDLKKYIIHSNRMTSFRPMFY